MRIEERSFENLQYIIRYPRNYNSTKTYPVLIFMHGAGTRGNDLSKLTENPFFSITNGYADFPFITVAPQCSADTWFDLFESIIKFVKNIYNCNFTDKNRVYAMGASMGGYAVWQMAMSCPELFAAIVPICGGGMYWNAERLKNIPVWAFHGDSDPVVNMDESIKMVNAVVRYGGQAKLTVYENCGHDAWSETYKNIEVFNWLLNNTKLNTKVLSNGFDNAEIYG